MTVIKRCGVCSLDYPFNYTVCPADGAQLEEVQASTALVPIIEVRASSPSRAEEDGRAGEPTLLDDFRELLEDHRQRRLFFERGPGGFQLQLSRAAVSLGLASLGSGVVAIGGLLIWFELTFMNLSWWWPDTVFALVVAWLIAPYKRIGRYWAACSTGIILLLHAVGLAYLCVWPVLTIALGALFLICRERACIGGLTVRFAHQGGRS